MTYTPNNDLIEGIAPTEKLTPITPSEKKFKPWHLPRKQWIRKHQWLAETIRLMDTLGVGEQRPLRYFSLPGEDLLDIRALSEPLERKKALVSAIGINDDAEEDRTSLDMQVSLNEQRSILHSGSEVYQDSLQDLAKSNSRLFERIKEFGDFDVVNLDFCKSVLLPSNAKTLHSAILRLVEHQLEKRTEDWLLFVTTRSDRETVDQENIASYWKVVNQNISKFEDFRDRLAQQFQSQIINNAKLDESTVSGLNPKEYSKLFSVGFGKWLLGLSSQEPRWKIEQKTSLYYRMRGQPGSIMSSLSYKFSRFTPPRTDHSGLGQNHSPVQDVNFNELECALSILNQSVDSFNLDQRMNDSPDERQQAVEESKAILKQARYDVSKYELWINDPRNSIPLGHTGQPNDQE